MEPELEPNPLRSETPDQRLRNVLIEPVPGLAKEPDARVAWAAERTALAWLRTGIALIAFGFLLARSPALFGALFVPGAGALFIALVGVGVIAGGVVASVTAVARHRATLERLRRGEPLAHGAGPAMAVGGTIAVAGALLAGYLLLQV